MNIGRMKVSKILLLEMMHLPPDTDIRDVYTKPNDPFSVEIIFTHPDLKPIAEHDHIPLVYPRLVTYHNTDIPDRIEFEGWGQI